jgi:acyl-CoA reductase-like NAD-dependent aldehyde dehydrogenase
MVENITDKVVKRLVQVTSAMKQDGENRVGLIKSETANKVSQKMAEASATRPAVVGRGAERDRPPGSGDPQTVIEVMETERLLKSGATVEVLPHGASMLVQVG